MTPRARWLYVFAVLPTAFAPLELRAQSVPTGYLGGGITLQTGDAPHGASYSVPSSHGYNLGVRLAVPLFSHVAVAGALEYRDVRRDDDATARELGYDPREFRLGGGFLEGGNRTSLGGLAHVQLYAQPGGGRLTFYLLAGGGLTRTAIGKLHRYFIGDDEDYPGTSQFVGMLDFGGGVDFSLGAGVGLFAQATRLTVFADEGNVNMIPIQLGLSFALTGN